MLRGLALMAVVAGAAGSLGLMFRVGSHNNSRLLMALFTTWVLSPFVALIRIHGTSRQWAERYQIAIHIVTLVVALGSLAVYGIVAYGPRIAKPASAFLLVPLTSWLLIGWLYATGRRQKRK